MNEWVFKLDIHVTSFSVCTVPPTRYFAMSYTLWYFLERSISSKTVNEKKELCWNNLFFFFLDESNWIPDSIFNLWSTLVLLEKKKIVSLPLISTSKSYWLCKKGPRPCPYLYHKELWVRIWIFNFFFF